MGYIFFRLHHASNKVQKKKGKNMKKILPILLVTLFAVPWLLLGCNQSVKRSDILFGEDQETAFRYFQVQEERVSSQNSYPEDQKAVGIHTDTYLFSDVPFGAMTQKHTLELTEEYWVDNDGTQHPYGITAVRFLFDANDFADEEDFQQQTISVMQKNPYCHVNAEHSVSFYSSDILTDEEWNLIESHTTFRRDTPIVDVTFSFIQQPSLSSASVCFTSVLPYVKHPDTTKLHDDSRH